MWGDAIHMDLECLCALSGCPKSEDSSCLLSRPFSGCARETAILRDERPTSPRQGAGLHLLIIRAVNPPSMVLDPLKQPTACSIIHPGPFALPVSHREVHGKLRQYSLSHVSATWTASKMVPFPRCLSGWPWTIRCSVSLCWCLECFQLSSFLFHGAFVLILFPR